MLLCAIPYDFDGAVLTEMMDVFGMGSADDLDQVDIIVCSPAGNIPYYSDEVLGRVPNLRILATASTGTNHIDLDACARRGIKVMSLLDDRAGLETISASAEWTFKLILEGLRLKRPYHELQGRDIGLVGYGRIGKKIQKWCNAFGNHNTYVYDPPLHDVRFMDLERVFRDCHVVVICCSLTSETTGMIDYNLLRLLPPDAVLVNTARGEVINEDALWAVMQQRPDLRVCLDVVTGEVNGTANRERLRDAGAYVTDHIAGDTYESRTKAATLVLKLLKNEFAQKARLTGAASPVAEVV